jgi:adenylate cyclase
MPLYQNENGPLTELQRWAGVTDEFPFATLAVVFTDIVGSTNLMKSEGDAGMFELLIRHFASARRFCEKWRGFEIKLIGDAYMVAFRTAAVAVRFAREFQTNTGDPRIKIRVGISADFP